MKCRIINVLISKYWPETKGQRCWVHKTANVLAKLPKSIQPKMKGLLHEIWLSETKDQANSARVSSIAHLLRLPRRALGAFANIQPH
ncbi:MAG: transposase [Ectothiorhodospiraceae bacterium]|nr:transposase [Ectothiorhodospiraceae bacterium]